MLELVNAPPLRKMLRHVRTGGTVCFTGAQAGEWTIADFSPFSIPNGTRLASYGGTAANLAEAHRALAYGRQPGKHVVVLAPS